ncbi:MAG: SsrA-binding protein SmpB [Chlorobi bacterium]|nr:SsrA-binding protein SmpB [Chlorobiota bacterium]
MGNIINIKNKKARHDYELLDKFVAGIQLYGTEIKSIRAGKASLNDSYCFLQTVPGKPEKTEIYVKMHISEYSHGTYANHEPKRNRKLLLTRKEINKIEKKVKASSLTIIPTRLFINDKGLAKLEIHIARGKKYHDKRESLKQADDKREMDRLKKMRF